MRKTLDFDAYVSIGHIVYDTELTVADDQAALRTAFVRALERTGFETIEATSGSDVLAILSETPCSAAVLDNHMPGATGLELIEAIRSNSATAELPVILATGTSTQEDIDAAIRYGANEFLLKPVNLSDLVSAVQRLVGPESR